MKVRRWFIFIEELLDHATSGPCFSPTSRASPQTAPKSSTPQKSTVSADSILFRRFGCRK